jgi:hypothetical protein
MKLNTCNNGSTTQFYLYHDHAISRCYPGLSRAPDITSSCNASVNSNALGTRSTTGEEQLSIGGDARILATDDSRRQCRGRPVYATAACCRRDPLTTLRNWCHKVSQKWKRITVVLRWCCNGVIVILRWCCIQWCYSDITMVSQWSSSGVRWMCCGWAHLTGSGHVMKRELQQLPHFAAKTDTINQKVKTLVEAKHGARSRYFPTHKGGGGGGGRC